MARPREHDDDTRDALLTHARRLLHEEGPAALSIRRVADAVGTTTRAIYSVFGSKEGLVRALHRERFGGLDAELSTVPETDHPIADLYALAMAYRRSALARPDLYEVMFACPVPEFEPDADDQALALGTLDRLRQAVARAVDTGIVRGDVEEDTIALWGLVHGLASLELNGVPPGVDPDRVWAGAVDAMLAGLSRP